MTILHQGYNRPRVGVLSAECRAVEAQSKPIGPG